MNKCYKLYSENGEANENDQSIRSDLCPFPQLKSRFPPISIASNKPPLKQHVSAYFE